MTAERRANYLERVAAAGARTSPSAKPAVVAPPRVPGTALTPLPISVPEPPKGAEFIASPGWIAPPANSLERESPSVISARHESPAYPAAFGQPPADERVPPQSGVEATQQVQEPPDSPRLPPPSTTLVRAPSTVLRAPSTVLRANTPATPTPQSPPARPVASSPARPPGRTPVAPAEPDVPSVASPASSSAPEGSASRERSAGAALPFPVTSPQSQSRETRHTSAPALNPPTPAALPRTNQAAQPATLPPPAGPAAPRKNESRISIGRIDVQVNNHLRQPSAAPNAVRSAPPPAIDLERLFLTRFSMRP